MFQVGDAVSYGTSGVCTIAEKKSVKLAGRPCECYILRPVYDSTMKICVPCDSQVLLQRMHALPSKQELLDLLQEPAPEHNPDPEARKEQYRQTLQSGDRHDLLQMIRDIYTSAVTAMPWASSFPLMRIRPCGKRRIFCTVSLPIPWGLIRRKCRILLPGNWTRQPTEYNEI